MQDGRKTTQWTGSWTSEKMRRLRDNRVNQRKNSEEWEVGEWVLVQLWTSKTATSTHCFITRQSGKESATRQTVDRNQSSQSLRREWGDDRLTALPELTKWVQGHPGQLSETKKVSKKKRRLQGESSESGSLWICESWGPMPITSINQSIYLSI